MAVSSFVLAGIGTAVSIDAAQETKKGTQRQVEAQKRQQAEQKKLADIKAQRERRSLVQEQLKAKSLALVAAGEQGSDSRSAGVLGSIGTKGASALAFAGQQEQVSASIFEQGQIATAASADIASASAKGQVGAGVSSLAGTSYNIFKTG